MHIRKGVCIYEKEYAYTKRSMHIHTYKEYAYTKSKSCDVDGCCDVQNRDAAGDLFSRRVVYLYLFL